jgi:hypothetical protein
MNKVNYIFPILIILVLIFLPGLELFAQGPPGDCCPAALLPICGGTLPPCQTEPIPLDGGLSALLIAGVAFGAKKLRGSLKS